MKQIAFHTADDYANAADIGAAHLHAGGLIAYPTETVYGFGCGLTDEPLEALASIKGGREGKSFLILIANRLQAPGLKWTPSALALAEAFWPGPLTLALRVVAGDYPPQLISARDTVAIRVTPHPGLLQLLRRYGAPITSTSANLPGSPPAQSAQEVADLLADIPAADKFLLLDGGTLKTSLPSTLVDCSESVPRVIRAGAIPENQLKRFVDELQS
jgi:L-threonylcarbamoyladenylate synthase